MDTAGNITREDLLDIVNGEDAMPITFHGWLHSITRESDNDKIVQRIERGMPYYETTLRERVGKNLNGNLIIRGECLSACAYLKDKGEKVDLVYIDPPFTSGADLVTR